MSKEEQQFVVWWEKNRLNEKKWLTQLSFGLPLGLVFGFPILLSVMLRGWYKRMPYVSGSQLTVILMACLGIAVFFGIMKMKFKWEMNEQRYKELNALIKKEAEKEI